MSDEGRTKVPVNWDMWQSIEASPDPVVALDRRAEEQLAMQGYSGTEVAFVASDPVFQQSVREQYQEARQRIRDKGKFPGEITIHFTRPGTRDKRGREEPAPSPVE